MIKTIVNTTRKNCRYLLIPLAVLSFNGTANSYAPKQLNVKVKTKVTVLATSHLRQFKKQLKPSQFETLLESLSSFEPDLIALEHLPSWRLFNYIKRSDYQGTLKHFAPEVEELASIAQTQLNLSDKEAISQLTLSPTQFPANIEERRQYILQHLAGFELMTAALQWQYFNETEQQQISLPDKIKQTLTTVNQSFNERSVLGIRLAAKLGHQQLYAIDDHSDKDIYGRLMTPLSKAFAENKVKLDPTYLTNLKQQTKDFISRGDMLAWYQHLNSDSFLQSNQYQWQAILDSPVDNHANVSRISLWELRNLNMVANIQRLVARNPGKKILIIVGASHKVYFDDYLNRLASVEVVQANDYLSQPIEISSLILNK